MRRTALPIDTTRVRYTVFVAAGSRARSISHLPSRGPQIATVYRSDLDQICLALPLHALPRIQFSSFLFVDELRKDVTLAEKSIRQEIRSDLLCFCGLPHLVRPLLTPRRAPDLSAVTRFISSKSASPAKISHPKSVSYADQSGRAAEMQFFQTTSDPNVATAGHELRPSAQDR